MKEKMGKAGYMQGHMEPHVADYQAKESDFAERGFSKTDEYIERQDAFRGREAKDIEKQAYRGRYS